MASSSASFFRSSRLASCRAGQDGSGRSVKLGRTVFVRLLGFKGASTSRSLCAHRQNSDELMTLIVMCDLNLRTP